jgi:hypothetical protein
MTRRTRPLLLPDDPAHHVRLTEVRDPLGQHDRWNVHCSCGAFGPAGATDWRKWIIAEGAAVHVEQTRGLLIRHPVTPRKVRVW